MSFFKAWFCGLLAAVVMLSAAEGSVMLCWHSSGELHALNDAHGENVVTAACAHLEHCCSSVANELCVDLQIDGLDLDFSADLAKTVTPGASASAPLGFDAAGRENCLAVREVYPSHAPPRAKPRVHISVPTTVLLI